MPATSYLRPRITSDIVQLTTSQIVSVTGTRTVLARAPVSTSPTTYTTVYAPPHLAFYTFPFRRLHEFSFGLFNCDGNVFRFAPQAPPFCVDLVFSMDL